MTAERPSADTDSADDFCFIPDTDLPQLDSCLENTRQILYQLSEIDTPVRCKIKENLVIVKGIFRVDELHLQLMLADLLETDPEGILLLELVICLLLYIPLVCNPYHGFKRLDHLLVLNLRNPGHNCSKFDSSRGLDNDMISPLYFKIQRVKEINLARSPKSYTNYFCHLSTSPAPCALHNFAEKIPRNKIAAVVYKRHHNCYFNISPPKMLLLILVCFIRSPVSSA